MVVRTKIEPLAQTIKLMVSKTLSAEAQKVAVASFAQGAIDKADDTNRRVLGRLPPRTITVDGRAGALLTDVKPDGGTIIVEWELIGDVLTWISNTLQDRSPHRSGRYQAGWILLADGVEVPEGEAVPAVEVYTFVNRVPYARKIEVGVTRSGRAFVIQVPNRIAERTAKDASARFSNIAKIRSTFISLENAYTLKNDSYSRPRPGHRRRLTARAGSEITYPAITVSLRAA